ncbi:4-(cytidine 5'-diphospho)-2-C-methyl-D-erythritol kinase [Planctomycetes bacterium K23_9]|uniref:4-diphosphocytidyl-2-C-methyl-D-erythritol kinase n=1 Tax=Stieleria marina TaxID=1930275 RepID=A0A517P2R2_9BACT|nr:4-diphosphocytidyl-2-C-methyl-D-erythritol kinase [Planctomycetes bacterium K23_9]
MKIAVTRPPAKLNLFLELLGKRSDGFHEIDTVMVPIDLCDELKLWRTDDPGIELQVGWLPSIEIVAARLGVECGSPQADSLLSIPSGESNLVHRALTEFSKRLGVTGGFGCQLHKRIPAGAGMGGASSDAASALLAAATLCDVSLDSPFLWEIAASIGSDVPFFLGDPQGGSGGGAIRAARARGRGEKIEATPIQGTLNFVVVFPGASLSTPTVYGHSVVPDQPLSAESLVAALRSGDLAATQTSLSNRLAQSAKEILPRIDEILKTMWRFGMTACQLTGSGSACFAVVQSADEARHCANRLRSLLEPGAFVIDARSVSLPAGITIGDTK